MRAHYKTGNGRITFEVEGETAKALFTQLASIQEVFDAETTCGMCGGNAIRLLARKVDDFDFYELACQNEQCRARFQYGQSKKGGALFPKRKDDDGKWLPKGGWSRYQPEGAQSPAPSPAAVEPPREPVKPVFQGDQTPDGLQPTFDRLATLLNMTAPTRLGPALDMLRDAMHRRGGNAGTAEFDQIYRNFEASHKGTTDLKIIKALLGELWKATEMLRSMV